MRQVTIYPGEDGYWVAECPSLPGCISQGRTKGEIDTLIATVAVANEAILVTHNTKHFENIEGLSLEDWLA